MALATAPPTPRSISSKITVAAPPCSASATFNARMKRDSSPQVAARGNTHYVIHKTSEGTVTRTSVTLLDEAGRQEEIARMLSGAEITSEARAQADRLLEGV